MTDRAKFEAWNSAHGRYRRTSDAYEIVDGRYWVDAVQSAWEAWQAACTTPAPAQPEGQEDESVGEAELMQKTAGVFTKAIFDANEVPPGTKLYLHPSRSAGAAAPAEGAACLPAGWRLTMSEDKSVRLQNPDGGAWRFNDVHSTGTSDDFVYSFLAALAAAPKEKP